MDEERPASLQNSGMDAEEGSMFEQNKGGNPMNIEYEANKLERSMSDLSPPKLKTTISLKSKSLIQKLFFGSMVTQISSTNENIECSEELFGPILLDPSTNYFYKSWENHFYNVLENFRETGLKASKWDLVNRFPEVLCFQIQRAGYNKEKKCPEKNNQRFEFDQEIYVDRFLMENRDIVQNLRHHAEGLEKERADIDDQLKGMNNFRENRDVAKSLEDVLHLLNILNSGSREVKLPHGVLSTPLSNQDQIITGLENLRQTISSEKDQLQHRSRTIDDEIRRLYSSIEKTKYVLFSIIIHEGTAESGHFYCYVKMKEKWFKFNDFFVREAEEMEVLETAFGFDGSIANAYCVFYMKEELFTQYDCHNFAMLGENPGGYYKLVPSSKFFNVQSSNMAYQSEMNKTQMKKLNSEYVQKYDQAPKKFDERYKDLRGKVMGMRSITDFFASRLCGY